jgi:hypothetical protein
LNRVRTHLKSAVGVRGWCVSPGNPKHKQVIMVMWTTTFDP